MIEIDGHSLTLEDVARVAFDPGERVTLAPLGRERLEAARRVVEERIASGEHVYGVTTGFGRLAEVVIPPDQRVALQVNVVRSHAAGFGATIPREAVRALMLLRANTLAHGHSGCTVRCVEVLLEFLARGIHPVVPEFGSVGASGDLVPLAHVALALLGEGQVEYRGAVRPAAEVLREAGVTPLALREKDGLALINGTQFCSALGVLALLEGEQALDAMEVAGAMSLDALKGSPGPFSELIQSVRAHPGQAESARRLRALLEGSAIRESHRTGDPRVQDAYSLRCMPQVHGAARDAFSYARGVLAIEINSATDNPLVFPETGEIVSGGNFHAQIVGQVLDLVAIAVADVASISERRVERILNPDSSDLPAFLAIHPGVESGLMMLQTAVADVVSELRVLATPASVQSVPTGANREDHVAMGPAAARKAGRAVRALSYVVAVELICAAEALEHHRPLASSPALERAHGEVRKTVPRLTSDRPLTAAVESVAAAVREGAFRS